jgi:hypothetical protein
MTSLTAPTVKVPRKRPSAADDAACYRYVTTRDKTCRAPTIDPAMTFAASLCEGHNERHHAGNTIGSKRITDARHVCLLCAYHHRTWAPTHSRMILEWLARVEDARERARHDVEEAQR